MKIGLMIRTGEVVQKRIQIRDIVRVRILIQVQDIVRIHSHATILPTMDRKIGPIKTIGQILPTMDRKIGPIKKIGQILPTTDRKISLGEKNKYN